MMSLNTPPPPYIFFLFSCDVVDRFKYKQINKNKEKKRKIEEEKTLEQEKWAAEKNYPAVVGNICRIRTYKSPANEA